jgi:beta-aspartyl-peptidase (threonine type)
MEFDASIMDGTSLLVGAVGALKGFPHPISVARKVMEKLPHVLLVGEGAARFALECGFSPAPTLSPEAKATWKKYLERVIPPSEIENISQLNDLSALVRKVCETPRKVSGTVNFLILDKEGNICSGVSTSGWFAKYPGRLGDTPVIGAGNYADSRFGAAACTGMGEMAIRACTARSVVLYLKMGYSLNDACTQAMNDLNDLGGSYLSDMNIVALDRFGNVAGYTNVEGETFIYMTDEMDDPVKVKTHSNPKRVNVGERRE